MDPSDPTPAVVPRPWGAVAGLLGLAAGAIGHALALAPWLAGGIAVDPARGGCVEGVRGAGVGLLVASAAVLLALVCGVSALAVAARQPWGRWLATGVALLFVPSGCAPVALVVLVVLHRQRPAVGP